MADGLFIASTVLLLASGALLVAATLIRFPSPRRALRELRPTEVALLRSGPASAVVTALVLLHARAAVDAGVPGTVRRTGELPRGCDPLARLVYESLARPGSPRELLGRPEVRRACDQLAAGLARAGLALPAWRRLALRVAAPIAVLVAVTGAARGQGTTAIVTLTGFAVLTSALAVLPARTAAGRRLVHRLRRRHADLTPEHEPDAAEWSPQSLGLAVALHGPAALRLTFPRFAEQGGLLRAFRSGARGHPPTAVGGAAPGPVGPGS